jgi:hypothetical protein
MKPLRGTEILGSDHRLPIPAIVDSFTNLEPQNGKAERRRLKVLSSSSKPSYMKGLDA